MTDFARLYPSTDDPAQTRGRLIGGLTAFVLLLALLVFVVETLAQLGVSQDILVWLVAGFGLMVPAGVAIAARTISRPEFAAAGRTVASARMPWQAPSPDLEASLPSPLPRPSGGATSS